MTMWVDPSGRLAEVRFTPEQEARLAEGLPVFDAEPVARWTAEEAKPHLRRRIDEIDAEQRDLLGEG
jgi:hypothetical protein